MAVSGMLQEATGKTPRTRYVHLRIVFIPSLRLLSFSVSYSSFLCSFRYWRSDQMTLQPPVCPRSFLLGEHFAVLIYSHRLSTSCQSARRLNDISLKRREGDGEIFLYLRNREIQLSYVRRFITVRYGFLKW